MKRVVIESPYDGDVERNVAYAKRCMRDALSRGESPIASHLLLTQILDDTNEAERDLGIRAGIAWHAGADEVLIYADLGVSKGMQRAIRHASKAGIPVNYRLIGETA